MKTTTCAVCGLEFWTDSYKKLICSETCRVEARRRNVRKYKDKIRKIYNKNAFCTECGILFTKRVANQVCCRKPECIESLSKKRSTRNNKIVKRETEIIDLGSVRCKCPRCERLHDVRMNQFGTKIMPRIYCPQCRNVIDSYEPGDFLLIGDGYQINIPKRVAINA